MSDNRTTILAPATSINGDRWSPWYHTGGIILNSGGHMTVSFGIGAAPDSPLPVLLRAQIKYYDGNALVTKDVIVDPEMAESVTVAGGADGSMSTVAIRVSALNVLLPAIVTIDNNVSHLSVNPFEYEKNSILDIIKAMLGLADKKPSPLAIDMDNDGIELTSVDSAGAVYWDHAGDGYAEASGWVGADDALLALDKNYDGIINNGTELFGDQTGKTNGFLALSAYDSNKDGKITSEDQIWSKLKLWQDTNGNAYSESSELHSFGVMGCAKNNIMSRVNVSRETFSSIIPPSYLTEIMCVAHGARFI